ncbi:MAG: tetratricopeptide repeat protein [Phycisphaerae bacterium]|nr:tetratricopeptide repeat protein [Phycisphaerae bacterium]
MRIARISNRIVVMIVMSGLLGGCASFSQSKQAAHQRYDQTAARGKIPLARSLYESGKTEDALLVLTDCLQLDPDNAAAHLLMGEVQLSIGRNEIARTHLLKAVTLQDQLAAGWAWLGVIAVEAKQLRQAQEYQRKALERDPLNVDYILNLAETLVALDEMEAADSFLSEKCRVLPTNVRILTTTANLKNRRGDRAGAIQQYRQTLVLDPDNTEVKEALAYCYVASRDWSSALDVFDQVINTYTGSEKKTGLEMMAMCAMNSGQYGRAIKYYDRLSVDHRTDPQLWLNMGQASLGAKDARRAAECARRALDLRPAWDKAVALRGCALYMENDYAAAIASFRGITSSKELGGFAWLMIGRCFQQTGDSVQAETALKTAASLNPDSKLVALVSESGKTKSVTENP